MIPLNHNDILDLQIKYKDDQTVLTLIDYIIELETQYLYEEDEFDDE